MGDDVLDLVPTSEAEADTLLNAIEAPSEETPPAQAPGTLEAAPPEPKDPFDFEDEITWRGENRKLHYSKIKSFAQQGYDYSEKMREYNTNRHLLESEKGQLQKERETLEKELAAYRAVDEYAKQNPQWWQHVQNQFQGAGQEQAAQAPPQIPPQLVKKLEKLESYVEKSEALEKARKTAEEDSRLDSEINVFRQQHPEIDWMQTKQFTTPNGVVTMSLEQQVCQYMVDNKIGSFRAAARDFLWDDIVAKREFKAKEKVGKEIQKATKYGPGSVAPTPSAKNSGHAAPSQFSYDELVDQALREFGVS